MPILSKVSAKECNEAVSLLSGLSASDKDSTRCLIIEYSQIGSTSLHVCSITDSSFVTSYSIDCNIYFSWAISFDMSYFFTSYIACDISVVTKTFYGGSFRLSISLTSYSLLSFSRIGFYEASSSTLVFISTLLNKSQSVISKFASFFFLDSKTCLNFSILGLRTCSESIIDMTGYQGSS